jgi:hypothetical protein
VTNIPVEVVDWILMELRTGTGADTRLVTRAAFIKANGQIVDLDGTSPVAFGTVATGPYYVVLFHRNHLSVMSHDPVTLSATSALYDFTTGLSKYFGGDAALLDTDVYGLYGGDADASGDVAAFDRMHTWNDRNLVGYLRSDVDLSGYVGALDRSMTWNNRNKSTKVPQ